jgi:CRP/FNR family transcriptional regulator, cyclic AMP receptor protein
MNAVNVTLAIRPIMKPHTATESMTTRVALHPFLAGMNRTQLVLLSDCASVIHFVAGQVIFREGESAGRFYLIETGSVVLEASDRLEPVIVDRVGPGDLLGWSWMFPPHVWHFTARATKPTTAIYFHGCILRQYCERHQALGYDLFKRMSAVMVKRLQRARLKMLEPVADLRH